MFNLFKSRPPIIIINEAEHREPYAPPVEKTWWEKNAQVVYFTTAAFHFICLICIIIILLSLKQSAVQANASLVQQLRSGDSVFRVSMATHYHDSVMHERNDKQRDSMMAVSFQHISFKINSIERKNRILENNYRKVLELNAVNNALQNPR